VSDIPASGTDEYRWWLVGARAEARAVRDGLTAAQLEVIETARALARAHPSSSREMLASELAIIFTAGKRRARWRLAWRMIRP
jgi:hypothetical protein